MINNNTGLTEKEKNQKLAVFGSIKIRETLDYGESIGILKEVTSFRMAFVTIHEILTEMEETGIGIPLEEVTAKLEEFIQRIKDLGPSEPFKLH